MMLGIAWLQALTLAKEAADILGTDLSKSLADAAHQLQSANQCLGQEGDIVSQACALRTAVLPSAALDRRA